MTRKKQWAVIAVVSAVTVGAVGTSCTPARSADDGISSSPPEGPEATPSSAVLAMLPESPEKRRLILDCTGCHQMDVGRTFAGGQAPRTAAEWRPIVQRMLQFGGVAGQTPLISPERNAAATAEWLAANLAGPPEARPGFAVPPGAEITPFDFPEAGDLPHDVAVDDDGRIVVTGMFTHQMMRLDPAAAGGAGSWEAIPIPLAGANPRAIEIDDEGRWWVLLGTPGKIARYDPSADTANGAGAADAWKTWDIGMYGHSIRLDGQGGVWFNGHFTRYPSIIGVLDSGTERVETFEIPDRPDPQADHPMPYGLRVAPDGRVWGTELRGNRLFAFSPDTETTEVFLMPEPLSGPRRPAVDPAGRIWIPEFSGNRLTRFDPAAEEFDSWELPVPDALPYVAEYDRGRGIVWLGTAAADVVFSFDPVTETFTAYPMPHEGALIRHLVVDEQRGDVWAAYGAFPGIPPRIVRIRPAE